jgi:large subunit ribosomal protein L20
MPRVTNGAARRRSSNRVLKAVKGHRGAAGRQLRLAKEAVVRAGVNARVGRKLKKRQFRAMWIARLSAACSQNGITYSRFIDGCKKAQINLNRKMLSELAICDAEAFAKIVEQAKAATA